MKLEFFDSYRKEILNFLDPFLLNKKQNLSFLKPWGEDVIHKIGSFTMGGKMIRGGLVMLLESLLSGRPRKENALKAAAAMELVQTSLLIHDDIMDRDTQRRGEKTVFIQYKESGDNKNIKDSYHFGEGMGICAGDIGFFLAFELISELDCASEIQKKLLSLFSRELTLVGIGQMQDLYFGSVSGPVTEESICQVYTHKTARYTFSLPMLMGSILAEADDNVQEILSRLGESMGMIFQIRDDELGLFGDEKEIGKPVGSDIKEAKKTLYYYYLFEKSNLDQKKQLRNIFGNADTKDSDIEYVRGLIEQMGIRDLIEEKMRGLKEESQVLIGKLPLSEEKKQVLSQILEYNLKRKK